MAAIIAISKANIGAPPKMIDGPYSRIASFSVAYKPIGGQSTTWVRCSAFGKTAEYVEKWCRKGDRVSLAGDFFQSSYTKNGQEIPVLECKVFQLEKLDYKPENQDKIDELNPDKATNDNGNPF
jgi:single-stranded DNA-binding protein